MDCSSLTEMKSIPENITNLEGTFSGCTNLVKTSKIPESIINMNSTFENCLYLQTAPKIPSNVLYINRTFYGCVNLSGELIIDANPVATEGNSGYDDCLQGVAVRSNLVLSGKSNKLQEIYLTKHEISNITLKIEE